MAAFNVYKHPHDNNKNNKNNNSLMVIHIPIQNCRVARFLLSVKQTFLGTTAFQSTVQIWLLAVNTK